MPDLTGADITAIGKVLDTFGTRIMYECDEAIYRAGLAAGRARAIESLIEMGFIGGAYADDARAWGGNADGVSEGSASS